MSQKNKADNINRLFTSSLHENEVAFMFLGYSGVILRTSNQAVVIDPANLLKDEEVDALKGVQLLLFTHSHGDHYNSKEALEILRTTNASVIAEPLVANDLKGKVDSDKLTSATVSKTYVFHDISVGVVQGIHRGPICLYHMKIDGLSIFHAGDSGYVPLKDYQADLAFLPTGSPSPTASPDNAFKMASDLRPITIVTIHGSEDQSKEFEGKIRIGLPNTSVIIPKPFLPNTVVLQRKT